MPTVRANQIDLYYEEMGTGDPIVLIMGFGAQMISWDDQFCADLAARGFRVIRFDNRDVGLSTKLDHLRVGSIRPLLLKATVGLPVTVPYTFSDMALDTIGLLDALSIDRAHIVGASMGGMIAQHIALEHPSRVRTLTSIMSHPGDRLSKLARPRAMRAVMQPMPSERQLIIDRYIRVFRVLCGSGFPFEEDRIRARAERAFDRCIHPPGVKRQFAAIIASTSRIQRLRSVHIPTLVIHGTEDPLIPPRGGRVTARAIPNARLRMIEGMGHYMPMGAWPMMIDEITELASAA